MTGHAVIQLGKKNRRDEHCEKILQLLYDDGPSTIEQIAEHLSLSVDWANQMLLYLRLSGEVTYFVRGNNKSDDRRFYWILSADAA